MLEELWEELCGQTNLGGNLMSNTDIKRKFKQKLSACSNKCLPYSVFGRH